MPPSADIRAASPDDAPVLAELRWEFRSREAPPIEGHDAFVRRCAAWMAEALTLPRWRAWLALADERAIGCSWLQVVDKLPNPGDERERHGYVTSMFVHPSARGAGIGAQLLQHALTAADRFGVDEVVLWRSSGSRTLYERAGFIEPAPRLMSRRRTG